IQLLLLIVFLIFTKKIQTNPIKFVYVFIFSFFIVYGIYNTSSYLNIFLIIPVFFSYLYSNLFKNTYEYYNALKYFFISLFLVTIFIMLFRLQMYNFDFIRARSGANIYGANAVINILILIYSIHLMLHYRKNDYFFILAIFIVSLLFISKTGILISLLLLLFKLFKDSKIINIVIIFICIFISFYYLLFFTSLGENILLRFSFNLIEENGLFSTLEHHYEIQKELQRGVLWSDAINLISENPLFGLGLGTFNFFSHQTGAHNIVLDNYAEFGILFGTFVNILFLYPFYVLYKYGKEENRWHSLFVYMLFYLQCNTAGQKILQTTGYISSFLIFCLFFFLTIKFKPS
ncbi:hypothetical protein Q6A77_09355, partial [Aliarcobacter skirrowii]|uniref:hypothetical protein n=1 Tax=Aliarcobacter skirrowii TaxID=28200 RepID=UPI0029A2733C